jgi:lysophospholipase L1-like esterase
MCRPVQDVRTVQYGWGGETASGFFNRMANDCLPFQPTVATTCYGMNDGGYSPMNEAKTKNYRDNQQKIVQTFKKAGVHLIVVGSPGCVDSDMFHKKPEDAVMYNKTLAEERDLAQAVAKEEGVVFANVFDPMVDVMTKAKAKYGHDYHLAGGDGVHPDKNGHLCMAYAFLKALGCDGEIGTITLDLKNNKAEATPGHKVLSIQNGAAEVESSRYPFCFYGDPTKTNSTRGVLEFLPFNQDLNRFKLVVKNAGAEKLKVTWGKDTKEYAAADLEKGINLAADFLDNPFSEQFLKVEQAIRNQQNFETPLVKEMMHNLPRYREFAPEEKDSLDRIAASLMKKDQTLQAASTAAVTPVKHTIKVEAAQ